MTSADDTSRAWRGRVFIGTSVDGRIARDDGSLEWLTEPAPGAHAADGAGEHPALEWETFFPTVDAIVMGRSTYETIVTFDPWPFDGPLVVVLTRRDDIDDPRVVVVHSVDEADALLAERGIAEVYVDGGATIRSFLSAGFIDEITVSLAPVLLGSGRPLFGEMDADLRLQLRGAHATSDGFVRATYDVLR